MFPAGSEAPMSGSVPREMVESLASLVRDVSAMAENCRGPFRKQACDLARRVKLLGPLFDELREGEESGCAGDGRIDVAGFVSLESALEKAKDLLRSTNESSKLFQGLQKGAISCRFNDVMCQLEQALGGIPYSKLGLTAEVQEQIRLVHSQIKRAKERTEPSDKQLSMDLSSAMYEQETRPDVLKRLSEKLQLYTMDDLKKESLALHEMVIHAGGDPVDHLEQMANTLKKLMDFTMETSDPSDSGKGSWSSSSPVIPEDFRCPMCFELMQDPVIVATGQTYERSCIEKWIDAGLKTCPKTQLTLSHTIITPNYALRSLIAQWCESNGVKLPKKPGNCKPGKFGGCVSECDADIVPLLRRLSSTRTEEQRAAAGELRLLAKRNADNRICIAEAGAIPLLVQLLSSSDPRTQEHAVTALLNLSIHDKNKGNIVESGAIPPIVEVLKSGSMEARENAAATLFSLSVVDDYKVAIGNAGAIPALVDLLSVGSQRGKKDAATALFNLSIYQGNKVKAVKAGIVSHLMKLLEDVSAGMMDESLAILAILASNQEGKLAIGQAEPVPVLVDVIKTSSPRNRENGVALLLALCTSSEHHLTVALELGAEEVLKELTESGTARAKRKGGSLLEHMHKFKEGQSAS
ncbi:U-box domain-containing protein 12 [Nymphaea thermarum]|nr:U-box domain-containing protein 12 [Nymphaea thermarum]